MIEKNTELQPNSFPQKPVILTPSALDKIKSMRNRDGKKGCGLRLGVIPGGCAGLSYEMRFQKRPYDNDTVIKIDADLEIFINPESLNFLNGMTIDYLDTLKESGFKYLNPNAQSSCGCGTSFS